MIVHDMPDEVYHSRPELSSTGARRILESPAKFKWEQAHRRESKAYDTGHAIHAKVLGVGLQAIAYPDDVLASNGAASTKAAKEWAAEARAAGMVPMKQAEVVEIDAAAEAVMAHPKARALFEIAEHREVSVFGDVGGVPCKARFDALSGETPRGIWAVDLKSTDDASEKAFVRTIDSYGYHVQDGHYDATYEASEGRPIDAFLFVVVEKNGPYNVGVYQLSALWRQMGATAAREARRIYAECVEKNEWPGLPEDIQLLEPPTWSVVEHEMRYTP